MIRLLQRDPEYAALYESTMSRLREAENATESALTQATRELHDANDELASTQGRTNHLQDGTRVYKDANGKVWNENGELVDGEVLEQVVWRDGAPTYEEFLARKKAAEHAQHNVDAILRYQVDILGHARQRLTDEDDPPSKDELKDIGERIEDDMPGKVREHLKPLAVAPSVAPGSTASVTIPDLKG